jgi:hypothetical protein
MTWQFETTYRLVFDSGFCYTYLAEIRPTADIRMPTDRADWTRCGFFWRRAVARSVMTEPQQHSRSLQCTEEGVLGVVVEVVSGIGREDRVTFLPIPVCGVVHQPVASCFNGIGIGRRG